MSNKRVVTIVIKSDGSELKETNEEVGKLSDGLSALDVAQVRELKQTLEQLGHTNLNSLIQSLKDVSAIENKTALTSVNTQKQAVNSAVSEQKRLTTETIKEVKKRQEIIESGLKNSSRVDYGSDEFKKKTEDFKKTFETVGNSAETFKKNADEIKEKTSELGTATENTTFKINAMSVGLGSFAGNVAASGFLMLIDFAVQSATAMVKYGLELDIVEKKFSNIIGNTQIANQHLKELRTFSLQNGADETWVISTAKNLERLKVSSGDVLSIIKAIGDSVAGTGGSQNDLDSISGTIENVIKTKRASLETIQSLRDSGISETDVWNALQKETGKTREELYNLAKAGKLTSETFIKAYKDMASVKFSGKMKEESETLAGSLKTLADGYYYFLSKGVGKGFDMVNYGGWVQNAAKWIKEKVDSDKPNAVAEGSLGLKGGNEFNSDVYAQQLEEQKATLENSLNQRSNILSNYQKIVEVGLNSHLRLTNQDELNYINQQRDLKASGLKNEIALQTSYYNQSIALSKGDAIETAKLTVQKTNTLRDLNTELAINEVNSQRQTAETERRILEERRQNAIQSKQLLIKEISQVTSASAFDFNRNIAFGNNIEENFEKLKNLTKTSYQEIARITSESYDIQLQNERLTNEERTNLERQKFLELQNLAEQNRERQLQIADDQYKEQIQLLERNLNQRKTLLQESVDSYRELFNGIQNGGIKFFNPDLLEKALFGGKTFEDLRKETQLSFQVKIDKDALQKERTQGFLDNYLSQKPTSETDKKWQSIRITQLNLELNELNQNIDTNKKSLSEWKTFIQDDAVSLGELIDKVRQGKIEVDTFDKIRMESLKKIHSLQLSQIDNEIKAKEEAIKSAVESKNSYEIQRQVFEKNALIQKRSLLIFQQNTEEAEQFSNTLEGLLQTLNKFETGDNKVWAEFFDELRKSDVTEKTNQIKDLAKARNELSKKGVFSQTQSDLLFFEGLNSRIKSVNETLADFKLGVADGFLNPIDSFFDRINKKLEKMPSGIREIAQAFTNLFREIIKQMMNKFIMRLFGFDSTQPVMGGGTSGSSQGFSLSNLFKGIFGGGSSSVGVGGSATPPFVGNNLGLTGNGSNLFSSYNSGIGLPTGSISDGSFNVNGSSFGGRNEFAGSSVKNVTNAVGSQVSNYTKFKSLFSGKGNLLGSMAPMLGMSLGASLGSGSKTGEILGSIGGLAGGVLGGIATGAINAGTMLGGIFGSGGALSIGGLSAAMSATVVLAPIAGALLIGSLLLKRNAARRRDETTRDALMVDTLTQLNQIKAEMEAAKSGINVQGLLEQTGQISANYFTEANKLKDKKTRGIAIKDGNERVGLVPPNVAFPSALTNQIYAASEGAKMKEQMRAFGDERDKRILPMFASGVFMDNAFASQYGDFKRRNGLLPGTFTGRDTLPSMLAMGEMVLNPMQQMNVIRNAGFDAFDGAGIPNYRPKKQVQGFAEGVNLNSNSPSFSSFPSSNSKTKQPIQLTLVLNNSGIVESDIQDIIFDSLDDTELQVKLLKKLNKVRSRE